MEQPDPSFMSPVVREIPQVSGTVSVMNPALKQQVPQYKLDTHRNLGDEIGDQFAQAMGRVEA